jgi:hypothetical protein
MAEENVGAQMSVRPVTMPQSAVTGLGTPGDYNADDKTKYAAEHHRCGDCARVTLNSGRKALRLAAHLPRCARGLIGGLVVPTVCRVDSFLGSPEKVSIYLEDFAAKLCDLFLYYFLIAG